MGAGELRDEENLNSSELCLCLDHVIEILVKDHADGDQYAKVGRTTRANF